MDKKLRARMIEVAEAALEAKVEPMKCYLYNGPEGSYIISLSNRPPKVFGTDENGNEFPIDMDTVFKIETN